MTIKIEKKRVPMPLSRQRNIFPFSEMKVGDSFFFERNSEYPERKLENAARQYQRDHTGVKFAIRSDAEGQRCWRVS